MSLVKTNNSLKNNSAKKSTEKRSREWIFILYPESAPKNWENVLKELHITYVISPLHDKDVNEDGTPKKAHHHILLSYNSVKSFSQIKQVTDMLNQPIPQICHNKTSQIRYFIHLDDPDKAQYERAEIRTYGKVDLDTYFKYTIDDELNISDDILDWCEENNVTQFWLLIDYARKNQRDWWRFLNKSSYLIREVLKSKHLDKLEKKQQLPPNNPPQTAADVMNLAANAIDDTIF